MNPVVCPATVLGGSAGPPLIVKDRDDSRADEHALRGRQFDRIFRDGSGKPPNVSKRWSTRSPFASQIILADPPSKTPTSAIAPWRFRWARANAWMRKASLAVTIIFRSRRTVRMSRRVAGSLWPAIRQSSTRLARPMAIRSIIVPPALELLVPQPHRLEALTTVC